MNELIRLMCLLSDQEVVKLIQRAYEYAEVPIHEWRVDQLAYMFLYYGLPTKIMLDFFLDILAGRATMEGLNEIGGGDETTEGIQ